MSEVRMERFSKAGPPVWGAWGTKVVMDNMDKLNGRMKIDVHWIFATGCHSRNRN